MGIHWIWDVEDLRLELAWNGQCRLMVGRLCSIVPSCVHFEAFPAVGHYRTTC